MFVLALTSREKKQLENFSSVFELAASQTGISNPRGYYELVFSAATWIYRQRNKADAGVWVQGVAGGQGSGKSTFAMLLSLVFERVFKLRTVSLSLDDFYLTHDKRKVLSEQINPLLATRGVPGTHDVDLMNRVIEDICSGKVTHTPRFDKSVDDREKALERLESGVDILIVEGWCLGAKGYTNSVEDQASLRNPINALEAEEDAGCMWRRFVDEQLNGAGYLALFQSFDSLFYLAVPDWDAVLRWRSLQEAKLIEAQSSKNKTMDQPAIARFIMFYERITRKMLQEMPVTADFTFNLNEDHQFISVIDNSTS